MQKIVCVLILASANLYIATSLQASTPRELYQRASSAIAAGQTAVAAELLATLVDQHGDSEFAEVAAFHLAECYQLEQRPDDAWRILITWYGRIDQSTTAETLAPGLKARSQVLLSSVLPHLPERPQTIAELEELISRDHVRASANLVVAIAEELSKRYADAHDLSAAIDWLRRAQEASPNAQRLLQINYELPLRWAEQAISAGRPSEAIDVLQTAARASPSDAHELAIRFLLAEAYYAAGESAQATEQFEWLTTQAEESSPVPVWLAAITLRRAELLVRGRAITAAQDLLRQAKQRHADFEFAYEFDYLLARCAVARIEFDLAVELLESVATSPTAAGHEATARALWMLGEVHFLQRHYLKAIAAYQRVIALDAFPMWQARALVQSAKCHELLGQAEAAIANYRRAISLGLKPEIVTEAASRLAALETTASKTKTR